jgi:hypothetical protein
LFSAIFQPVAAFTSAAVISFAADIVSSSQPPCVRTYGVVVRSATEGRADAGSMRSRPCVPPRGE